MSFSTVHKEISTAHFPRGSAGCCVHNSESVCTRQQIGQKGVQAAVLAALFTALLAASLAVPLVAVGWLILASCVFTVVTVDLFNGPLTELYIQLFAAGGEGYAACCASCAAFRDTNLLSKTAPPALKDLRGWLRRIAARWASQPATPIFVFKAWVDGFGQGCLSSLGGLMAGAVGSSRFCSSPQLFDGSWPQMDRPACSAIEYSAKCSSLRHAVLELVKQPVEIPAARTFAKFPPQSKQVRSPAERDRQDTSSTKSRR